MIRGRVPPGVVLAGRALVVVLAVVPLFLVLTRSVPPAPAGTAAPPDGLRGIGTGVTDSSAPPSVGPVGQLSVPDGIPPASPVTVAPGAVAVPAAPAAAVPGGAAAAPAPSPAPKPLPLKATYATVHSGLTGYDGQVTLADPNAVPGAAWTVVLTLPVGELVTAANNASYTQSLTTVTVTGNPVPAHGTLVFTISVTGLLGPPTACTVDANPCQLTK